jgi:hypothetical protein
VSPHAVTGCRDHPQDDRRARPVPPALVGKARRRRRAAGPWIGLARARAHHALVSGRPRREMVSVPFGGADAIARNSITWQRRYWGRHHHRQRDVLRSQAYRFSQRPTATERDERLLPD